MKRKRWRKNEREETDVRVERNEERGDERLKGWRQSKREEGWRKLERRGEERNGNREEMDGERARGTEKRRKKDS